MSKSLHRACSDAFLAICDELVSMSPAEIREVAIHYQQGGTYDGLKMRTKRRIHNVVVAVVQEDPVPEIQKPL